jgi:hypothetical protein
LRNAKRAKRERSDKTKRTGFGWCPDSVLALCEYRRKPVENILGWGSTPSGTLRFKKIDGSFWNGETFRFADYKSEGGRIYGGFLCQIFKADFFSMFSCRRTSIFASLTLRAK